GEDIVAGDAVLPNVLAGTQVPPHVRVERVPNPHVEQLYHQQKDEHAPDRHRVPRRHPLPVSTRTGQSANPSRAGTLCMPDTGRGSAPPPLRGLSAPPW